MIVDGVDFATMGLSPVADMGAAITGCWCAALSVDVYTRVQQRTGPVVEVEKTGGRGRVEARRWRGWRGESNIASPLLPQGRLLRNSESVALFISSDFVTSVV